MFKASWNKSLNQITLMVLLLLQHMELINPYVKNSLGRYNEPMIKPIKVFVLL